MEEKFNLEFVELSHGELSSLLEERKGASEKFKEAISHLELKQIKEAVQSLSDHLAENPNDTFGHYCLGNILRQNGQHEPVDITIINSHYEKSIESSEKNSSRNVNAYLKSGMIHFELLNYAKSIEYLLTAEEQSHNIKEEVKTLKGLLNYPMLEEHDSIPIPKINSTSCFDDSSYEKLVYTIALAMIEVSQFNSAYYCIKICMELNQGNLIYRVFCLFYEKIKSRSGNLSKLKEIRQNLTKLTPIQFELLTTLFDGKPETFSAAVAAAESQNSILQMKEIDIVFFFAEISNILNQKNNLKKIMESCAKANLEYKNQLFQVASIEMKVGNYVEAKNLLTILTGINQKRIDYLLLLGKAQYQLGEFEAANKTLGRCINNPLMTEEVYEILCTIASKQRAVNNQIRVIKCWTKQFPSAIAKNAVRMAKLYIESSDYDNAIKWAENGIQLLGESANLRFMIGKIAFLKREYPESMNHLKRALELDPSMFECHFLLAQIYWNTNELEESRASLKEGFAYCSDHAVGLLIDGQLLLQQNKYKESIKSLKKSQCKNDKECDTLIFLGVAYSKLSKFEIALACLNKAKELFPTNVMVVTELAGILLRMNNYEEALEILLSQKGEIESDHQNDKSKYYFKLGQAYSKKGKAIESRQSFELCIDQGYSTWYVRGFNHLFDEFIYNGRQDELINKIEKVIEGNSMNCSKNPALLHLLGKACFYSSKSELSIQYYEKCLSIDPCHLDCILDSIRYKLKIEKNPKDALSRLEELHIESLKDTVNYKILLCEIYIDLKELKQAASVLNSFLVNPKDNPITHHLLGCLQIAQNTLPVALATFRANSAYFPSKFYQGRVQLLQKKYALAQDEFKRILVSNPNYYMAYRYLGEIEQKSLQSDKAITSYRKYLSQFSNDAEITFKLAELLVEISNVFESRKLITSVLPIMKKNAEILTLYGITFFKEENYEIAYEHFKDSLKINDSLPRTLFFAAQCERNLLDLPKAIDYMRKCVAISGPNIDYSQFLGSLLIQMHQFNEAEKLLLSCAAIHNMHIPTYQALGDLYMNHLNDPKKAIPYLIRIHGVDPSTPGNLLNLLKVNKQLSQKEEFIHLVDKNKTLILKDKHLAEFVSDQLYQNDLLKNWSLAKDIFIGLISLHSATTPLDTIVLHKGLLHLSIILYVFNEPDEASKYLRQIPSKSLMLITSEKTKVYYLNAMIEILKEERDLKFIKKNLTKGIKLNKDCAYLRSAIAYFHLETSNLRNGDAILKVMNSPDKPEINVIISNMVLLKYLTEPTAALKSIINRSEFKDILTHTSLEETCYQQLNESIKQFPQSPLARYNMGTYYIFKKDFEKAKENLKFALDNRTNQLDSLFSLAFPSSKIISLSYSYATALYKNKEQNKALDTLRSQLSHSPNSVELLSLQYEILYSKNELKAATEVAEKIVLLGGQFNDVYSNLISSYLDKGDILNAVVHLEEVYYLNKTYENTIFLAECYTKINLSFDALQLYLSVLSFKAECEPLLMKCLRLMKDLGYLNEARILVQRYEVFHPKVSLQILYFLAQFELSQSKSKETTEVLRKIISHYPSNIESVRMLGRILLSENRIVELIALFEEFETNFGDSSDLQLLGKLQNSLGNAYFNQRNIMKAIYWYEKSSRSEPKQIKSKLNNALCHLFLNQINQAADILLPLSSEGESHISYLFLLGLLYQKQNQVENAIKSYSNCLCINEKYTPAALNLASIYRKNKQYKLAINILEDTFSSDCSVQYHLALTCFAAGKNQISLKILEQLITDYDALVNQRSKSSVFSIIYPNYLENKSKSEANNNNQLNQCQNEEDNNDNLEEFYLSYQQQGLQFPTKVLINLLIARIHRNNNRIDLEIAHLESCLKVDSKNVDYMFYYGNALQKAGKYKSALPYYESCVKANSKKAPLYLLAMSTIYNSFGETFNEIEILQQITAMSPSFYKAHDNLGVALMRINEIESAEKAFTKSIQINPENPISHYNKANLLLHSKKVNQAISSYKKCLELSPNHIQALFNLGIAYQLENDLESASSCFTKCANIDPHNMIKYEDKISIILKRQLLERKTEV